MMGKKPEGSRLLVTLPVVLGVIVVIGGLAALAVSGLFVYRAHTAQQETARMQVDLQQARERSLEDRAPAERELSDEVAANAVPNGNAAVQAPLFTTSLEPDLRPGARLQVQRPARWDEAEVLDVLEDSRVKVRWLSGEPGESVIASDLVRSDGPPTN